MLAHQDLTEATPLHDAVEDERAAADHVDAPRMHHADRGAFGPRLGEQAAGHGVHIGRGHAGVVDPGKRTMCLGVGSIQCALMQFNVGQGASPPSFVGQTNLFVK